MAHQAVIIVTTTSGEDLAEIIAQKLVEGRLAACVQIIANVKSVYLWEGHIESASESLLVIKTGSERYAEVEQMIRRVHRENAGYQTPEILRIDVDGGSSDYLNWLFLTTGKDGRG